jgi:hypothetical protein
MGETAAERAEAIQTATQGLSQDVHEAAINAAVPAPDATTSKIVWIIVSRG